MNTNTNRTSVKRRALGLLPARAVIYVLDPLRWPRREVRLENREPYVPLYEACEQIAQRLGLRVVGEFVDYTLPQKRERIELQHAIDDACRSDVEYLIVFSLDHLEGGQKPPALIGLELRCAGTNVVVVEDEDPELASRAREVSR